MPQTKPTPVSSLSLDPSNYRTVKQRTEIRAIQALIAVEPAYFWALSESLLDDGYLPTENILVLDRGNSKLEVKEGNRRIAALKIIHGLISRKGLDIPKDIQEKIANLPPQWKQENENVPCTIYGMKDAAKVDRIVQLAHGKDQKARRLQWNAVAGARHNRDYNGNTESGLDLLEKYLAHGKNITAQQKELWAGVYPLTVLGEAMWRIADRFRASNSAQLAKEYPNIIHRNILEQILNDIGNGILKFPTIRKKEPDFGTLYGLPAPIAEKPAEPEPTAPTGTPGTPGGPSEPPSTPGTEPNQPPPTTPTGVKKVVAVSTTDPKAVIQQLQSFIPLGNGREKVVLLRNEAINLNLKKTPLAFCFVLRSLFEISAKAYCDDHAADPAGPKYLKSDNQTERRLVDILRDIYQYLVKPGGTLDKNMEKVLHGAMVELGKPDGILSVTSMNQLVHSPVYALSTNDICIVFGNIFPLLVAMNS